MKNQLLFALCFCLFAPCFGQMIVPEVSAASGGAGTSASAQLSWTVGEMATPTLSAGTNILTQGFQQTNLTVVAINEGLVDRGITADPNPTRDFVIISVGFDILEPMHYELYDVSGKFVRKAGITESRTRVEFDMLSSGVYYLGILENGKNLKNFKIVKQ